MSKNIDQRRYIFVYVCKNVENKEDHLIRKFVQGNWQFCRRN